MNIVKHSPLDRRILFASLLMGTLITTLFLAAFPLPADRDHEMPLWACMLALILGSSLNVMLLTQVYRAWRGASLWSVSWILAVMILSLTSALVADCGLSFNDDGVSAPRMTPAQVEEFTR